MYSEKEIMEKKCPLFAVSSFMAFIGDRIAGINDRDTIGFAENGCKCRGEDCAMIGWATMRDDGSEVQTWFSKESALYDVSVSVKKLYYYCGLKP